MFCPEESNETIVNHRAGEQLKLIDEFHENLVCILKAQCKSSQDPIPYIPCPECPDLHFNFKTIRGTSKRALRCKTKIRKDYYADFRETAGMNQSTVHFKALTIIC